MDELLSESKTSRGSCVTLRTVLQTRLLFGLYSCISCKTILRFFARIYCFCLAFANSAVIYLIFAARPFGLILMQPTIIFFNYHLNVLIHIFTDGKDFLNYCKVIEQVDAQMGYGDLLLITPAVQIIFLLLTAFKVISSCLFVYIYLQDEQSKFSILSLIIPVLFIFMNTAANFNSLMNVLSLDLLRNRLFLLRHVLKSHFIRNRPNNRHHQILSLNNCLQLYKTLIDNMHITLPWAKLQIFANFITAFIIFVFHGQLLILDLKHGNFLTSRMISELMNVFVLSALACLPGAFAELVTREVENFKTDIGDELLDCEDDELRDALELAADYLELRPFRITFCRVFAFDASFTISFLSLCTTSLIVLIQITGVI